MLSVGRPNLKTARLVTRNHVCDNTAEPSNIKKRIEPS